MNIALWVLAGLLAPAFLGAGMMKLTKSRADLEPQMAWVGDFTDGQVKAIGALEVLGAVGLILPGLTGIAPILVPIAATGLALLMAGAAVVHVRRHDPAAAVAPAVVLCLLSLVVAVGRFGPQAFS